MPNATFRRLVGVLVLMCSVVCPRVHAVTMEPPVADPVVQPSPPASIPDTPAGRTLKSALALLGGDMNALQEKDFAPSFLKAVPMAQLRSVAAETFREHGAFTLVEVMEGAKENALVARVRSTKSDKHHLLRVGLDAQGQIETLLIQPDTMVAVPALKNWKELDALASRVSERAAIGVFEIVPALADNGGEARTIRTIHVLNGEESLAIGSTFKLWILGALAERVRAGEIAWDQKLAISAERKSLPSGVLQNRPVGEELPISEYALKMISISDNTATDHLLHHVGRTRTEAFMRAHTSVPERNTPMLSTRDMFALKLSGSDELPKAYLAASEAQRREMVEVGGKVSSVTPQLLLAAFWKAPRFIETLEWFATPVDLAKTFATLDGLMDEPGNGPLITALTANPGVPMSKTVWTRIAFKGGSEPGVLNLTWLLMRDDGRKFVLTLGFNDTRKEIDHGVGTALAARSAELLERWDRVPAREEKDPLKIQTP
ncbi:MAG: serine hydrolase [Phycisphaerales bacterium]|nr:serine hydrolase [Phycisphaerales bacterium]